MADLNLSVAEVVALAGDLPAPWNLSEVRRPKDGVDCARASDAGDIQAYCHVRVALGGGRYEQYRVALHMAERGAEPVWIPYLGFDQAKQIRCATLVEALHARRDAYYQWVDFTARLVEQELRQLEVAVSLLTQT